MNSAQALDSLNTPTTNNIVHLIQHGEWVAKPVIISMYGFSDDLLKKYRCHFWLEGKHYKKNPANTIVYNPTEIDRWNQGL